MAASALPSKLVWSVPVAPSTSTELRPAQMAIPLIRSTAPGNPVYQLLARFFTIFTDKEHAAAAINALSAVCSALTIFFLYLTIVFFAKRLTGFSNEIKISETVAVCGAGAVGALCYCFSDTFWFSAVEAEVYAMSSMFTAIVFWAMTRWYEEADKA